MTRLPITDTQAHILSDIIKEIEQKSTGKVLIHVDDFCKGDALFKASKLFKESELLDHPQRNAALIYMATKDRKIAIVADEKLDEVLPENFIEEQCEELAESAKMGKVHAGFEKVLNNFKAVWEEHFAVSAK